MRYTLLFALLLLPVITFANTPVIAVASNLSEPLTKITGQYESQTGKKIKLTFGSSGNLARQIVQGAPFRMFISADKRYVDFLVQKGAVNHPGTEFIRGPVGIFIPDDSILAEKNDLKSVINALMYRSYRRIAIANPEHAPYGVAALEALQSAGLWALEQNRLVLAENVSQVIQYALSGSVDAAVIPYSFMKQEKMVAKGRFFKFPENWYASVIQHILLLDNAGPVTRDFADFLYGDTATSILREYGYIPLKKESERPVFTSHPDLQKSAISRPASGNR